MNIDLLTRLRRTFSRTRRSHNQTDMETTRPARLNKSSRSKSAGALVHQHQQEDLADEDIPEVHRPQKRNGPNTAESLLLDRELLENLVWRLNVELGRYETRLRAIEGQGDVPDGERIAPAWCRADPTTLGPLMTAYDEALSEKDAVIEKYELRLKELGAELREVVYENDRLQKALEEVRNESAMERNERELASKDVESLHSENVALLGRLEDYKTRVEDLEEQLIKQRHRDMKKDDEFSQQQAQMKALARDYRLLQEQLDEAMKEVESRVPQQHHQSSINECKTLLEELRSNYDKDRKLLEERVAMMTKEKVEAEARARLAHSEANHSDAKAKALEKLLRRAEGRSERLQTKLVDAESCRDSSVRELKQLMAVAEKLTIDQENLIKLVSAKRYCCEDSPVATHKGKLNQNKNKK